MPTATPTEKKFDFQLDEFYLDLQEEGRRISILSPEEIAHMPFPGLRPFKTSEFQLFKGRGGQAEELLKRLQHNRFLAVIGSSGTGKSSLVRAGLIPQLFGGYLHGAGSRWNIAICRPGKNPIANLAIALSSVRGESKDKSLLYENYDRIEPMLNRSMYGLLDVNAELNEGKTKEERSNLLVIVDQFEELFRYDRKDLGHGNIESYFVDLLLKAAANQASPVYVIITMRSEFLGDCVKYRGLPEAINQGQYLVPGLNRTQLKEVIEGPINLAGREISPGLTELLINEIDEGRVKENLDQLPILQHALMRTYQEAARQQSREVNYDHYVSIGEMEKALANHAKTKFDELCDAGAGTGTGLSKKQKIAKLIFQALTDASTDLKGGRRPTELKNIYAIAGVVQATKGEVNAVVDHFRDSETSFIMPPINTTLHDELMLDISHESLMRNWDLLKSWVEEETRNGKLYRKLDERKEDRDDWMPASLLQELLDWQKNCVHSAAWAARYHEVPGSVNDTTLHKGIYGENLAFLQRCEAVSLAEMEAEKQKLKEEERQRQEKEAQQQKEKNRKRLMAVLTIAAIIAICLSAVTLVARNKANKNADEADEQRKLAVRAQKLAEQNADTLAIQKMRTDSLLKIAIAQKEYSDSLVGEITIQATQLAKSEKEAKKQADTAMRLRKQAVLKQEEFAKQVAINILQDQDYYQSEYLDQQTKEQVTRALFYKPIQKEVDVDTFRYVKRHLLERVNEAAAIRANMEDQPEKGINEALHFSTGPKDTGVNEILLSFFKNSLLYKSQVAPFNYDHKSFTETPSGWSIGSDGRVVFATGSQVVSGKLSDDGLLIDEVNWIPAQQNQFLNHEGLQKNGYRSNFASVIAMASERPGRAIVVLRDGRILEKNNDQQRLIGKIPQISSVRVAELSADGLLLATVQRDVIRVWDLSKASDSLPSFVLTQAARNKEIEQLTFSPDNRKLLATFDNNTRSAELYTLHNKGIDNRLNRLRPSAANFANHGRIVLMTNNGYAYLLDSIGNGRYNKRLFSSSSVSDDASFHVSDIRLSPDYKNLLVSTDGYLVLYQGANGDSVFSLGKRQIPVQSKKLFALTGRSIIRTGFSNSGSIIGMLEDGSLCHWDTQQQWSNLADAFRDVAPILATPFAEWVTKDTTAFDEVLIHGDVSLVREAADHYFSLSKNDSRDSIHKANHSQKARQLYQKLLQTDRGYLQAIDTLRLLDLDKPPSEVIDTTYEMERLTMDIREDIELINNKLLELQELRENMTQSYWDLSWYQLFRDDPAGAVESVLAGLALDSTNKGIRTNLAPGYLLKGDFKNAEATYRRYRDTAYDDERYPTYREVYLKDLDDLEKHGVISKNTPLIYDEMMRIRTQILGWKKPEKKE